MTTCLDIARRLIGTRELPGGAHHPMIQWGFMLCGYGHDTPDEVPWCSAGLQIPPYLLGLPRSQSAAARSWLKVGEFIELSGCKPGNDVVILNRGGIHDPTVSGPGHVGLYVRHNEANVWLCGGNQNDSWSIAPFPVKQILGARRLT